MKFVTAILADFSIAFLVWVMSDKLTSGLLVFIVVLGMLAICVLTSAAVATVDGTKVKATVDDVRK